MLDFFKKKESWAPVILRVFFGIAFLVAALDKVLGLEMAKGMFTGMFGGAGTTMLFLAIAIELLGGLALLFNYKTREAALVLVVFMLVALVMTFKLGEAANMVGVFKEMLVMNTGGGNTAVNFAYLAGLLALAFNPGKGRK